MDDPGSLLDDLGRDLFIEWLIIHYFHKDIGDPAISELSQLTKNIVQVLIERELSSRGVNQQQAGESVKALNASVERFVNANRIAA